MKRFVYSYTAWRVSAFEIFLVRIFLHSDWYSPYSVRIRENTNEKNCEYRNFSRCAILTIVLWYETSVTAYHHKKLKLLKTESLSVPSKWLWKWLSISFRKVRQSTMTIQKWKHSVTLLKNLNQLNRSFMSNVFEFKTSGRPNCSQ